MTAYTLGRHAVLMAPRRAGRYHAPSLRARRVRSLLAARACYVCHVAATITGLLTRPPNVGMEGNVMAYPKVYHAACNHLVHYGGRNRTAEGRKLVAQALRALRAAFGRAVAQRERRHLLFISGHFPVKVR